MGPSGCGKSTLLRAVNRMHELYKAIRVTGEILLNGEDIMKMHPTALKSDDDLKKLGALITTYLTNGGKHIQFNVVDNETLRKAQDILTDRIRKGKCWEQPFLGCREHTAYFKPYEPGYMNFQECCPEFKGTVDFGYMLHHIVFDETGKAEGPKFYRAIMTDGIIPVYKEKDVILSDFSQTQ